MTSSDAERTARAAAWRADEQRRRDICAGLDWQDCADALAKAGEISRATAEAVRRMA